MAFAGRPEYFSQPQLILDGDFGFVRLMRDHPPAHYMMKIESFSKLLENLKQTKRDKYESSEFTLGGYKWQLCIYPQGKKEENGEGYLSMHLKMVDKLRSREMVTVSLKFIIYDQIRSKYLTILDLKEKSYHDLKNEWGVARAVHQSDFNDIRNGFLMNDYCVFGVEAFVLDKMSSQTENEGISVQHVKAVDFLLEDYLGGDTYTWKINKFSELEKQHYSPVFTIEGYKWKLQLYPEGDSEAEDRAISLYLCLDDSSDIKVDQKLRTEFDFILIDQIKGKDHLKDALRSSFCSSSRNWGLTNFICLDKFNDPSTGFRVNDSVILQVTMKTAAVE